MKSIRLFSTIVVYAFALLLLTVSVPYAKGATKVIPPPPPVDTRILIKSIDVKAGTVTLKYMRDAKAPDHTYGVDDMTLLKVNNVAGKITDIKIGMVVDSYLERDNDNLDALSLSGYGGSITAPAKPKTPAKPKPTTTSQGPDSAQ